MLVHTGKAKRLEDALGCCNDRHNPPCPMTLRDGQLLLETLDNTKALANNDRNDGKHS